jgi:hypothetical protein
VFAHTVCERIFQANEGGRIRGFNHATHAML